MKSKIRYTANRDGQAVAYQVFGNGPLDLVFIPDWVGNLDVMWEDPTLAAFLKRLARFARVICFDKRGTGLSDPVPSGAVPTWEEWMYDVGTVMDAAASRRAAIFGHGDGGAMALLFAATSPDRTTALVLADAYAKRTRAGDYPCGLPEQAVPKMVDAILKSWGTGEAARVGAPSLAGDAAFIEWRGRFERLAMSPGQFNPVYPRTYEVDLRWLLPTVRVPTLVLHRAGNSYVVAGNGRFLADNIEGAHYIELPGEDHFFHAGDVEAMLGPVQEFLTGRRVVPEPERVLATVLFTDIVGATAMALGEICSRGITPLSGANWHASEAVKSTPRATVFSPPSRGLREGCAVRWRSATPFDRSVSTFVRACTPVSASDPAKSLPGSQCTSVRGWPQWRRPGRCWFPGSSRTSSPVRGSRFSIVACTGSRESATAGSFFGRKRRVGTETRGHGPVAEHSHFTILPDAFR